MNLEISTQLLTLSRNKTNARKRIRLLAVSLFFEGENRANIARRLNTVRISLNKWGSSYLEKGLTGLGNKPISGHPANLTSTQQLELSNRTFKGYDDIVEQVSGVICAKLSSGFQKCTGKKMLCGRRDILSVA